jgi:hypothetical protein
MRREPTPRGVERCPFLADRLWRNPTAAYCGRPDARLRVPSAQTTLACICSTRAHLVCPAYLERTGGEAAALPA